MVEWYYKRRFYWNKCKSNRKSDYLLSKNIDGEKFTIKIISIGKVNHIRGNGTYPDNYIEFKIWMDDINAWLYKMLTPTETIEKALPKITEAFVNFYGEENFNKLNNLFHLFYEKFNGMEFYSVIDCLKNNVDNEYTKFFKQICLDMDNILANMKEISLLNNKQI